MLCVVALAALQIGSHAIALRLSPKDARAPRDERERLIAWRSQSLGYYVLMVGILFVAAPAHFGHPVRDLLNITLLAVVFATLTVALAQIVMYRRGG